MFGQSSFDLPELDTETTQFDLVIAATDEIDGAVAAPADPSSIFEIARATAAASPLLTRSLKLFVAEGIYD